MTQVTYLSLCGELGIDPNIALENTNLVAALKNKKDLEVIRILAEEF